MPSSNKDTCIVRVSEIDGVLDRGRVGATAATAFGSNVRDCNLEKRRCQYRVIRKFHRKIVPLVVSLLTQLS